MNAMLYLALLDYKGQLLVPANAHTICTSPSWITYEDEHGKYIKDSSQDFEVEQIAYDKYDIEFDEEDILVSDFIQWKAENRNAVVDYLNKQKDAIGNIAMMVAEVEQLLAQMLELSEEYSVPCILTVGDTEFDIRKIECIDWDSSSMYC